MNKWWQITIVALVVIAVGLGCLFGGRAWGSNGSSSSKSTQAQGQSSGNANGQYYRGNGQIPSGGFGNRNGGGMVSGSIIAADATSITVKTSAGSTKIVLVGSSATVSVVSKGSVSDLTVGQNVVVVGTANSDGTVTASTIRLGETFNQGSAPGGTQPPGGAPDAGSATATTQATTN